MTKRIHAAILGGAGYGSGELLRLLTQHPQVEVVSVTSTSQPGEPVEAAHPHLRGFYPGMRFGSEIDWPRLLDAEYSVVFSALPHGASGSALEMLLDQMPTVMLDRRPKLLDLSGDLRLQSHEAHGKHYPDSPWLPEFRRRFVYGLAELHREEIRKASCIANPGCLATASILAGAPLVREGFKGTVAIDAKTGSSGSGRQLKETTHHATRHADFRAYKPLSHQHEGEILQAWGDAEGKRIELSFVAQSMDTTRGIFVTAHLSLPAAMEAEAVVRRYVEFYAGSPFVRIVPGSPTLQDVVGSNFCDISIAARGRQVIAMAALDNLVKGMSGAAIQNMNLMCGLPETTGLWSPSYRPA